MSHDLSQFYEVFFEECFELLEEMEASLLGLEQNELDSATIDTIFRAAHSIKGGAATFNFKVISEFTHVVEAYLDEVRKGNCVPQDAEVSLLLKASDCIRAMVVSLQSKQEPEMEVRNQLLREFKKLVASVSSGQSASPVKEDTPEETTELPSVLRISFKPDADIYSSGNDPKMFINDLAKLCELEVEVDDSQLPDFDEIVPSTNYLSWKLRATGDIDKDTLEGVFAWIDGQCELVIEQEEQRAVPVTSETEKSENVSGDKLPAESDKAPVKAPAKATGAQPSASIRVGIEKVDSLINIVGELVITQSMLNQVITEFDQSKLDKLKEGLMQLEHNSRELQESVMRIRMLPISFIFSRFPRMVRDLAKLIDKKIELEMIGETTEIDKTMMEKLSDPIVHIVRNSADHGIELPEVRKAAGKSEVGKITLNAYHQGGNIIIEITDDGAGLNRERILEKAIKNGLVGESDKISDREIDELVFHPGFSTAESVTDISGRGVGMDVVKRNITSLGGSVDVRNDPGNGSCFTIRLPLTLAILDGQMIMLGEQVMIIPLVSIIETLKAKPEKIKHVSNGSDLYALRDKYIPIVRLHEVFNLPSKHHQIEDGFLVIVESGKEFYAIFVDDLLAHQQVVIKSLEQNYERIAGISGATVLGDGNVALILDVAGVVSGVTLILGKRAHLGKQDKAA